MLVILMDFGTLVLLNWERIFLLLKPFGEDVETEPVTEEGLTEED